MLPFDGVPTCCGLEMDRDKPGLWSDLKEEMNLERKLPVGELPSLLPAIEAFDAVAVSSSASNSTEMDRQGLTLSFRSASLLLSATR